MDLKRFWPWKTIDRLEVESARLKKDADFLRTMHQGLCDEVRQLRAREGELELQLAQTVKELDEQKELVITKEGHMRKLGTILAMKAGITGLLFLLSCLSVFGQVLNRNINEFATNQFGVVPTATTMLNVTNTAGAVHSIPHIGSPSPQTNAVIWNDQETSANIPQFGSFLTLDFFYFNASTNSVNHGNFYLGCNPFATDGTVFFLAERENGSSFGGPVDITPAMFWTNGVAIDSLLMGQPIGAWLIKTNATHAPIGWAMQDSTVINDGGLWLCKLIQFSTVQASDETLEFVSNIVGSTLLGPVMDGLTASTNDIMISAIGNNWTGPSTDNTFLTPGGLGNSVVVATNTIVGPELDTPVDGVNGQGNWCNNIWTTMATTSRTPSPGTVTINSTALIRSRAAATNGYASYATNIQAAISNLGFTNDVAHGWGTNNMIVDIITVGETVAFYNRSGAQGQTSCGTLLFTDTGIANKEYNVGVNCGVTFSVGTFTSGTARAY